MQAATLETASRAVIRDSIFAPIGRAAARCSKPSPVELLARGVEDLESQIHGVLEFLDPDGSGVFDDELYDSMTEPLAAEAVRLAVLAIKEIPLNRRDADLQLRILAWGSELVSFQRALVEASDYEPGELFSAS